VVFSTYSWGGCCGGGRLTCATQPCTNFNLDTTAKKSIIGFKMQTTICNDEIYNSQKHMVIEIGTFHWPTTL